jgi:peptidoglycan hydrolase-like protein with peptidoglycan-binding domain
MSLMYLGYTTGGVDGWFGTKTQAALLQFQRANGLSASGRPDPQTKFAMEQALAV